MRPVNQPIARRLNTDRPLMSAQLAMLKSAWIFPAFAIVVFAAAAAMHSDFTNSSLALLFAAMLMAALFGAVFAAVHHAEVIARRVGEPYGTLVLTLSVTVIEVALIANLMVGEAQASTLARDTVFATVMIVCNGLVGLCIFIGGLRYREQGVQVSGASVYLSVLFTVATLTLILPNFTSTIPGPTYSKTQLEFVALTTIVLYCVFLYTQTFRHREYFISEAKDGRHAGPVSRRMLAASTASSFCRCSRSFCLPKVFRFWSRPVVLRWARRSRLPVWSWHC
jgi:Ca2+:H+ antiporter